MPALENPRHERFYVYAVRINGRTRYVGKGCGKRYRVHLTRSHNEALASEIAAARVHNEKVRVRIIKSDLSERSALSLERRMIFKWSNRLTNVSMGGHSPFEAASMACRADLRTFKSEADIIREGDRKGVSVQDRLALRQNIISRLTRLERLAEAV